MIEAVRSQPAPAAHPAQVDAAQRARMIYTQARSEMSGRLWQAALGTRGAEMTPKAIQLGDTSDMAMDSFLALIDGMQRGDIAVPPSQPQDAPAQPETGQGRSAFAPGHDDSPQDGGARSGSLGPNAVYSATLNDAAERTGVPAPVIAAIVNAEAARDGEGRWLAFSRNPRSSAAGLGQFLSGTWIGEAQRPGTWLNQLASANGWLDGKGHVRRDARHALLERRYDGHASIHAVADYARFNLDQLHARGIAIGQDARDVARAAYLGHHLGLKDAARFLEGGLSDDRAQRLLSAQVGASSSARRIAAAGGSASSAHRAWLLHYVDSNLRPISVSAPRNVA